MNKFYNAAINGNLALVKSMHEGGMVLDAKFLAYAKLGGRGVLEYAYTQGAYACKEWDAIEPGVRVWLVDHKYHLSGPWTTRTVSLAAIEGRADVLKWLHENGDPRTFRFCAKVAAAAGHAFDYAHLSTPDLPATFNWLHNHGGHIWGGWDTGTFAKATEAGVLNVVKFLYDCGCEIK